MSHFRPCIATLLVLGWLSVGANLNTAFAQLRPSGLSRGPRADVRPDGPPPPGGAPRAGAPHQPLMGPGHVGPPHGRFGQEHELRRMEELKELDPPMYELETADRELDRQTLELSEQYRRAPADKREALQKQLEEAVGKHFEVRQARRELHLKRLAEELEKLRESIERRNEVREQIIGQRVSELMGKENDLAF